MGTWNLGSLSLTRQQTEITIWRLAANQKVKVTLMCISLLESRVRKQQCPHSAMKPSAKVLDSGCLLVIWDLPLLWVSWDTLPYPDHHPCPCHPSGPSLVPASSRKPSLATVAQTCTAYSDCTIILAPVTYSLGAYSLCMQV